MKRRTHLLAHPSNLSALHQVPIYEGDDAAITPGHK